MILLPQIARWVSTIGVILMCFSLALSSFSTSVTHLILSQGIGFGVGGSLAYTPSILFMPEWFVKRKGLAFGVVWVSFQSCQVWAKHAINTNVAFGSLDLDYLACCSHSP
jgi:MFS family permease